MKRTLLSTLTAAGLLLGAHCEAHLIDNPGILYTGSNDSKSLMGTLLGISDLELLFKAEYDDGVLGKTEGALGDYITITHPYGGDDHKAEISWDFTGSGYELYGVAWKNGTLVDGNPGDKGFYYSAVSADQYVVGDPEVISTDPGFKGAFSHIAFYGKHVPDAGTSLVLFGAGLFCIGAVRRRHSK